MKPTETRQFKMLADEIRTATLNRLKRIEGQVRGLEKMVEEDRYCVDILNQVASVQEALRQVSRQLMRNYLENCATSAILRCDGDGIYDELMDVIYKYAKY